jgi:transglutaminase-like putative cysteine protease
VPRDSAFTVAAAVGVALVAVLADAFAFRAHGRAEAVVPAGVMFVFTAALGVDRNRVLTAALWCAAALAAIAVLRAVHHRDQGWWLGRRRRASTTALPAALTCASLCALGAALAAPLLPGAGQEPLIETRQTRSDDPSIISPLVDIRSRMVNRSEVTMFTVSSAAGRYWRLSGLDRFDGTTWTLSDSGLESADDGLAAISDRARIVQQQIVIRRLGGRLVPAAYLPVEISQPGLGWLERTGTIALPEGTFRDGQVFNVASDLWVPNAAELDAATATDPPSPSQLDLPDDFPDAVVALANDITAEAPTPYRKALALQTYFRDNFTYDLRVQRGHSEEAILSFLRNRRGYCEQFSATFAAMARSVGLPARVAVGFTQGELRSDGRYHVLGRHAHAWPEVWFDGIGWVLFEPTPGRGAPGSEEATGVAPAQETATPGGTSPDDTALATTVPVTTVAGPTATSVAPQPGGPATTAPTGGGGDDGPTGGIEVGSWILLALLAAAAWVVLMPRLVRRVTPRSSDRATQVIDAWHGAVSALMIAGAPSPGGSTPLEYARLVERELGIDGRPLAELGRFVSRAVYSPAAVAEPTAMRAAVLRTQIVEASDERLGWGLRLWCRVDPRLIRQRLVGQKRRRA